MHFANAKQRHRSAADQLLSIRYPDSFLIKNFKLLAFLCNCTDMFVSDLVGNPEDLFFHVVACRFEIDHIV